MSLLSDKINSYAIERGIAMEETFSVTPTRTGTNPLATFTRNTTGTQIVYSTDSPVGGGGSWSVPYSTTTANNGYLNNTTASTTELLGLYDYDWSIGFWFKIPTLPGATSNSAITLLTFGGGSQGGASIHFSGSAHATNPSQVMIDTANNFTYSGTPLLANTWYYLALTRQGSLNNNHKLYINGQLIKTFYDPGTGTTQQTWQIGHTAARGFIGTYQISNYYLAPTSVIGPTQIGEIYTAGITAPPSNNLKYWNGTAWTIPTNKYQWDGINWITMTGSYWNGSAWVSIT